MHPAESERHVTTHVKSLPPSALDMSSASLKMEPPPPKMPANLAFGFLWASTRTLHERPILEKKIATRTKPKKKKEPSKSATIGCQSFSQRLRRATSTQPERQVDPPHAGGGQARSARYDAPIMNVNAKHHQDLQGDARIPGPRSPDPPAGGRCPVHGWMDRVGGRRGRSDRTKGWRGGGSNKASFIWKVSKHVSGWCLFESPSGWQNRNMPSKPIMNRTLIIILARNGDGDDLVGHGGPQ